MNRREIYTYADIRCLREADYYGELKKYPQITVSTDLQKGLKGTGRRESFGGKMTSDHLAGLLERDQPLIHDFKAVSEMIFPKWASDAAKFRKTMILSEFFRRKLFKADNEKTKNWLSACKKNTGSILSAILLLEECGIRPEDMSVSKDKTLLLFAEAWKYLEKQDTNQTGTDAMTILSFRKAMENLKKKETWEGIFCRLYGNRHPDKIILHGFYDFTPLQQRIFDLMEAQGVKLLMLFPYDERYPFVNEIWDRTYSEKNGYPARKEWHRMAGKKPDAYGEIFEGNTIPAENQLKIKKYDSVLEFADDIRRIKKSGFTLYSAGHRTANEILKDFYPEEYGERKLLSYPIGQFVDTLNHMWDEDEQTILLDKEKLMECFSSGWLTFHQVSGKQYLQDLKYLLPFFKGCRRVTEWEQRIARLERIRTVSDSFCGDTDANEAIARWQEFMGNPFAQFGPFASEPEKLQTILQLIRQLLSMARDLFGQNEPVRVKDQLNRLNFILKSHEISEDLYEEEHRLIEELFQKLDDPFHAEAKGYPSDIAAALNIYLTGRLEEGEIQPSKVGLVMPMYQIDAAPIKNNGRVHICFCDMENMPGKKGRYAWPLTADLIENLRKGADTETRRQIEALQHMTEESICTNRYFFYSALKNRTVELSYIAERNGAPMAPSPYLVMLKEAFCRDAPYDLRKHFITYGGVAEAEYTESRVLEYDRNRMPEAVPKEAKMDYAVCPMKYILSYVVEKHPAYSTSFQQNYAVNGLIEAIYALTQEEGITQDEIYTNVIELFPNLRSIEKRQIKDYLRFRRRYEDGNSGGLTQKGNCFYTDERLKVCYPNQRLREDAFRQYELLSTPEGRQGLNLYEASDGKDACIYCPHEEYCRNARFAVDSKKEQENYYD